MIESQFEYYLYKKSPLIDILIMSNSSIINIENFIEYFRKKINLVPETNINIIKDIKFKRKDSKLIKYYT